MFKVKTLTDVQIYTFVTEYNNGKTLAVIAAELGCSVPTAGRLLKKAGANMRGKGRPKGSKTVNRKSKTAATTGVTSAPPVVETPTDEKLAASAPGFLDFQQKVINYNS